MEGKASWGVLSARSPYGSHSALVVIVLISQVPTEANPANMVAKLSQLTSLLSSIEDKVFMGVLQLLLAFLWSSAQRMPRLWALHPYDSASSLLPIGQGLAARGS
jgi:hypothetical protein